MIEVLTILFIIWLFTRGEKKDGYGKRSRLNHDPLNSKTKDNGTGERIPTYDVLEYEKLSKMTPRGFELHCAAWVEKQGEYYCEMTKAGGGDGNVDFFIRDKFNTIVAVAECKRHQTKVGAKQIKVLHATMGEHRCNQGWFFSLSGYSIQARQYVKRTGVNMELIDCQTMTSGNNI